ncbi:hypothetical protein EV361DRAFT_251804 [Lentinula raphanica]|nr:hypothetical protein EV361DRAFT_251804 [Lentinula raphanica]
MASNDRPYPLRSLLLLFLTSSFLILHVMSSPLPFPASDQDHRHGDDHDRAGKSRVQKSGTSQDIQPIEPDSATGPSVGVYLIRSRKLGYGWSEDLKLKDEPVLPSDQWRIYFGSTGSFGFSAAMLCNAALVDSWEDWPWIRERYSHMESLHRPAKSRPLNNYYETIATLNKEKLVRLSNQSRPTWQDGLKQLESLIASLPIRGPFQVPDSIMQLLWEKGLIEKGEIDQWNVRVKEMLRVENTEMFKKEMEKLKADEREKRKLLTEDEIDHAFDLMTPIFIHNKIHLRSP